MASLIDAAGRPLKVKASPARTDGPQGPKKPGAAGALIKDSGLETFAADVLDTSMEVPVIVDFWAPWCGPCKQLGPMLERLVTEANGAVRLVKVNIDENPEIAQQLRIQSIPTVYAFKQGQPVDGFMGAIPESQLRQFIEGLAGPLPPGAAEEAADLLAAGVDALAKRDLSRAAQLFGQLLQEDPGNPKAVAGLARCYLESGDLDRARKTLKLVRPDGASDESYRAAEAELALKERAAAAGDAGQLNARVAANPADLAARFDLALVLDGRGAREAAIDQLLEIIRRDRKWNDDAARKHLLTLFDAMGPADPRTLAGRRRLSSILFS
ncbi:MAG: thioredoxin [Alphaproteobacteria bacterium]|nr:thioredoxin [Alphaproteobacteria bacterium]